MNANRETGDNAEKLPPDTTAQQDLHAARQDFSQSLLWQHHQEIIEHPSSLKWPHYPYLCLTHRREREQGLPALGIVHARGILWVLRGNLYALLEGEYTQADIDQRSVKYESVAALLSDWQVD